jgi:hypothetical protein
MSYYADVEILVNGKPIKKFAHQGKIFIQSNHDTEYSIRVRNLGCCRRLFVVTVDGINVIDGKAGGSTKMGYIIHGYAAYEIKGFRTSNDAVHPFKFNSKSRSYAAKSDETQGDTRNCGVIGIDVYDEKQQPILFSLNSCSNIATPTWTFNSMQNTASPMPPVATYTCNTLGFSENTTTDWCEQERSVEPTRGATRSAKRGSLMGSKIANFDMGTEFSQREVADHVTELEFEIGNLLESVVIYYASRNALADMGVPVVKETYIPSFPEPFPSKFCKPPRR